MRRGEVYLVDLEPAQGSVANKVRPAVLVSNDAANKTAQRGARGVVTVVPVTSNVARVYPFQAPLTAGDGGLAVASKAQAEQVRSIDVRRLRNRLGVLPVATMQRVDVALRTHLAI